MKHTILNTTLSLALSSSLFAGPAEDIAKKHATATAAEIEVYLKENPDAADRAQAQQMLLISYKTLGQSEKTISIFKEKFDSSGEGSEANLSDLYNSGRTLFNLLVKANKKDEAMAIADEAIKKSVGHPKEKQLINAYTLMKAHFNKPEIGDSMDIKFTSLKGQEVDLGAMKGKVVLIDFWATWCGPCIREIPHLKKAYEKYHDKGFEVIAISVDEEDDKAKLEALIKEKEIPWVQHFDGKGSTNEFALKYGINSYPSTFLIGKDGKVVATNLRGEELEKALEEHLSETKAAE